jgi:hypothetical protein
VTGEAGNANHAVNHVSNDAATGPQSPKPKAGEDKQMSRARTQRKTIAAEAMDLARARADESHKADSSTPKSIYEKVIHTVESKHRSGVTDLIKTDGNLDNKIQDTIKKNQEESPEDAQLKVKIGFSAKSVPDPERAAALAARTDSMGKFLFKVYSVMHRGWFDGMMGLITVTNTITIGLQLDAEVKGQDISFYENLEIVFFTVYLIELLARFATHGVASLRNSWVKFDLAMIFMSAIDVAGMLYDSPVEASSTRTSSILKLARLVKMVRAARAVAQFRDLWFLLRGLLSSANTLFAISGLLLMILYVFACVGIELITKSPDLPPQEQALVDKYFPDVFTVMLTLVRFVFHDSTSEIYRPLVLYDRSLVLYFMVFFLFVSIALMNLVTAVILEENIEQRNRDAELHNVLQKEMKRELLPKMVKIFEDLDADKSGELTFEELLDLRRV